MSKHTFVRRYRQVSLALAVIAPLSLIAACGSSGGSSASGGSSTGSSSPASSAAGAGSSGSASLASLAPSSLKNKTLSMAAVGTFPPDIYIDNGKSTGWELDLVNAALQLVGLKAHQTATTFDGIVPGLQNGKFDLAPDTVVVTADRIKAVDIVTVAKIGTSFAAKAGSGTTINSVTDLCGHTVATLSGSLFITQLQDVNKQCQADGKPQLTVQTYQDIPSVVLAVANGRAETLALGTTRLDYYKNHANGALSTSSLVYLPKTTGIALAKNSPLSKPLVAAINELIADGQYKSILAKYGVSEVAVPAANIDK